MYYQQEKMNTKCIQNLSFECLKALNEDEADVE